MRDEILACGECPLTIVDGVAITYKLGVYFGCPLVITPQRYGTQWTGRTLRNAALVFLAVKNKRPPNGFAPRELAKQNRYLFLLRSYATNAGMKDLTDPEFQQSLRIALQVIKLREGCR